MMETMTYSLALRDLMLAAKRDRDGAVPLMEENEFRLFYERTARPLWSYLSRLTGDPHKADDFLQEAYYRFYRAGAHHVDERHRRNSLYQIATNLVRDDARRNTRYPEVELTEQIPAHSRDGSVIARTDIQRAMSQLQPAQREILWLAYAEGSSHEEIAQILGVRAMSVRTILLRARRKLAEILTEKKR